MNSTAWRKQGFLIMNILLWTGELLMLSIREGNESEGLGSWSLFGITAAEGYSEVWKGRKKPSVYLAYKNSKVAETPESACLSSSSIFFLFLFIGASKKQCFVCLTFFFKYKRLCYSPQYKAAVRCIKCRVGNNCEFLFFLIKHFKKSFYFLRTNVI